MAIKVGMGIKFIIESEGGRKEWDLWVAKGFKLFLVIHQD